MDATDAATFPTEQSFDTVIFLNVLEHLADDGRRVAQRLPGAGKRWNRNGAGSVRPGGFTELWTKCSDIVGDTRRNSWSPWGSPRVSELSGCLNSTAPGIIAWWLNGKMLRRRTFGLAQIRLLNLLTPLFRVLESWLPVPPLSLIAIFRKEEGSAGMSGVYKRRRGRCESRVVKRVSNTGATEISMRMRRVEETHANLFTNYEYEKILALIFVCTLPLVNPWVRGDGVGYYAFARAPADRAPSGFPAGLAAREFQFPDGPRRRSESAAAGRIHFHRPR